MPAASRRRSRRRREFGPAPCWRCRRQARSEGIRHRREAGSEGIRRRGEAGSAGTRRRRRRASAAIVLVVPALVGGVAGRGIAGGAVATPALTGGIRPVTPILSVRRLPGWITDTVADQRLAAGLPAVMAKLGPAAATSCLVVSRGDNVIFAAHPTEQLVPASNVKLLTAIAVLDKLGPTTRLKTTVTASVRPVGGTVHGDLYLVGGGDPLLWTPGFAADQNPPQPLYTPLAALAANVRAAGITAITGSVLGDESLFDTQRRLPTWSPAYEEEGDIGPLSALEVDNGFASAVPRQAATQPAVTAAAFFTGLLRAAGVTVAGAPGTARSPATAPAVTSIASAPLGQVLGAVLRVSDDTGAELLTKLLGRRWAGVGSTAAGVAVVRADLAAAGLPVAALHAVDGSGLDRSDRATCALMDDAVRHVGTTGAVFAGLPVAGRTGTLALRMVGTPAAGRLHAKTGTLDGVAALSGFVLPASPATAPTAARRAPIAFSLIVNGIPNRLAGEAVGDALGVYLALPPSVPPLRDAVPAAPIGTP